MSITIVPAYGRDYKSKVEILIDFNANKDFKETQGMRYINKSQIEDDLKLTSLVVRYGEMRKVTSIKRRKDGVWI